ncbi:hypothetical protein D3C85_1825980 [compost metagenome]
MSRLARASGSRDGSKLTKNDTDGLNWNSGPALMAMNGCPWRVNDTMSQSPDGVFRSRATESIVDCGNAEQ